MNAIDSLLAPCDSGYCDWIYIDGCASSFSYSNVGSDVTFYNTSYGAVSASWTFGDGGTSTAWAPTHTYPGPGIYNACLTTTDSSGATCGTYCLDIDLGSAPSCGASFSAYDSTAYKVFVSSSSGSSPISTYFWDFGDGSTSIMARPFHRYLVPGTYNVCLTITTLDGCSDTQCNTITVLVGTDDATAFSPSITAWPNPTSGQVWLAWELPIASDATLEVFDLVGHRLSTVSSGFAAAGRREMQWDASGLPTGVYLVRLTTQGGTSTLKLVKE
jgi:PKD repeat protein